MSELWGRRGSNTVTAPSSCPTSRTNGQRVARRPMPAVVVSLGRVFRTRARSLLSGVLLSRPWWAEPGRAFTPQELPDPSCRRHAGGWRGCAGGRLMVMDGAPGVLTPCDPPVHTCVRAAAALLKSERGPVQCVDIDDVAAQAPRPRPAQPVERACRVSPTPARRGASRRSTRGPPSTRRLVCGLRRARPPVRERHSWE